MRVCCVGIALSGLFFLMGFASLSAQDTAAPRNLGPGVLKTIRPFISYNETFQYESMPEIVAENENYQWARDLWINKEIWCLEFSFKPVRMMEVDFPTQEGKMEKKLVWYLVYSVTNTGKATRNEVRNDIEVTTSENIMVRHENAQGEIVYEPKKYENNARSNNLDGIYENKIIDYNGQPADENGVVPGTVQFVPRFVIVTTDIEKRINYAKKESGYYVGQSKGKEEAVYNDQFLPIAFAKIAVFEDRNRQFLDSVRMAATDIKPGETKWGIATWTDVDARIDKFSVYISGLTNAVKWVNEPESYDTNADFLTGRDVFRKVLKLNFIRPGDEFNEKAREIYYGLPGELDYQWVWL
ncbi:MAG: hypothetical protein IKW74_00905 [Thermoguttaceae bacterium]|nr:hypothetical protein [Thermoguttaceae bacterium]